MRFIILILFLLLAVSAVKAQLNQSYGQEIQIQAHDQIRQNAVKDFSKTKLFKKRSFFYISFCDTVCRMKLEKPDDSHYKWVRAKVYNDLIAINILPDSNMFFLDTTITITQNKGIPSRCIEQDGKLFFWYDDQYSLTNSTIKLFDKYHLLWRGAPVNAEDHPFAIDDSAEAAEYYFCKSNLFIFKRVITSRAIGAYDPPEIVCK